MSIYNSSLHKRLRKTGFIDNRALGFQPTEIEGIKVWLSAYKENDYNDGDSVGIWHDQSGNGNNAVQSTEAYKPAYISESLNGFPVIRLNGINSFMSLGDLSAFFPTAATLLVVAKIYSDDNYTIYTTHPNSSADIWWSHSSGAYYGPFRTGRYELYPSGVPQTGTHLFVIKSTTGTGTYEVIIDGISKGTQDATHSGGTEHKICLNSENKYLLGDIPEIIVFNNILNNEDIAKLSFYLNDLYSIF